MNRLLYVWIALIAGLAVFAVVRLATPTDESTPLSAETCMREAILKDLEQKYDRGAMLFKAALNASDFKTLPLARRLELKRINQCRPTQPGKDYFAELAVSAGLGRWDKSDLKIYVAPDLGRSADKQIESAWSQWSQALDGKLHFHRVQSPDDADIIFVPLEREENMGAAIGGLTCFSAIPENVASAVTRSRRHVVLLPQLDNLSGDARALANLTYLHELGHALGLQGHSIYGDDAMFCECKRESLSPRDVQTIRLLYEKDYASADERARKALAMGIAANNPFALLTAADLEKDSAQRGNLLQKAASAGWADAQARLGLAYEVGDGVPRDAAQARRLYEKAAAQDSPEGMTRLAQMLQSGPSEELDRAIRLFDDAANLGYAPAQYLLGGAYEKGQGIPKDDTRAAQLYEAASLQGYPPAHSALAQLYATGRGVSQNMPEAFRLYKQAAEAGDGLGQLRLGFMYYKGVGTKKDRDAAITWWRKAAAQNIPDAYKYLKAIQAP